MNRAIYRVAAHFILFAILGFNGFNVSAQSGEEYFFRWDTDTSFDQIPFGNLVGYVFASTAFAKSHEVLTDDELVIIHDAYTANPKPERTYRLFEEACIWYQEIQLGDRELDFEYMGTIFALADQYESEDKNAPYLAAYEMLSPESKKFVLEKIGSLRGTRVMSSVTTNYQKLFVDYPESAENAYERLCSRLPEMLNELQNWPAKKLFENTRVIGF